MSKEIIIDGVDVTGCEYMLNNKIKGKQHCPAKAMPYAKETSCICRKSIDTPYNFCKHNPNCHFKQLKRLQEENKRLQMLSCANCGEKYLSPDGSELYDKNVQLQQQIEALRQNWRLDCLKCEYKNTKADVDKYKQALEEIRSYCDEQNLKADYTACEVLAIIDEVLDEN